MSVASSAAKCRPQLDDGDAPTLIVQSYYVHSDNYALRIRLKTRRTRIPMDRSTDPLEVLDRCRDLFSQAFVTIKGPAVGGTRYEAEREIDTRIAVELVKRGGDIIIKNRYSVWIDEGRVEHRRVRRPRTPRWSSPKRNAADRSPT